MKKAPSIVYWFENNLYLNITNRCSNNCYFCFRRYRNELGGFNLKLIEDPTPDKVIRELQRFINKRSWDEIVFCGFGEPLQRLNCIIEVTKWIKTRFRKVVRIDTNGQGYLLNRGERVIEALKEAGVDKVRVSLNAHNKETYNKICRPETENAYDSVLTFIKEAKEHLDVEVTAVAVPEVDLKKVKDLADRMSVRFRKRKFIPCFL